MTELTKPTFTEATDKMYREASPTARKYLDAIAPHRLIHADDTRAWARHHYPTLTESQLDELLM